MPFRYWDALGYVDEVIGLATAVSSYLSHRDESQLADDVTRIALEAAQQAAGGDLSVIDEEKLRQAIVQMIDALEPLMG